MGTVSLVIITKNEAPRIRLCLESARWADEIVVVDSGSTDGTVEICREFTDKVIERGFDTFEAQKNFAVEQTTGEWILSLDADEVLSPEASQEIRSKVIDNGSGYVGYVLRRENYLCGTRIRHVWGHDRQLRLFQKGKGRFCGSVHERVMVHGDVGELIHPLLHYNSVNLWKFLAKNELYTNLEARRKYESGERLNLAKSLLSPVRVFFFRFVTLGGYRDGTMGLVLSMALAYFALRVQWKIWRMKAGRCGPGSRQSDGGKLRTAP